MVVYEIKEKLGAKQVRLKQWALEVQECLKRPKNMIYYKHSIGDIKKILENLKICNTFYIRVFVLVTFAAYVMMELVCKLKLGWIFGEGWIRKG